MNNINPYRKVFEDSTSKLVCDFSDQIPAWFIKVEGCYSKNLFLEAIRFAESKKYYNFYMVIALEDFDNHLNMFNEIDDRYDLFVEEKVPCNERSINNLFWDWILNTIAENKDRLIVSHVLSKNYRDKIF
jgi:hypothetical protein